MSVGLFQSDCQIIHSGDTTSFDFSYMKFDTSKYQEQLQSKIDSVSLLLSSLIDEIKEPLVVISSPSSYFRHRCRFAIEHKLIVTEEDMASHIPPLSATPHHKAYYAMWDHGGPEITLDGYPVASKLINELMQPLLNFVDDARAHICDSIDYIDNGKIDHLKAVQFLSTTSGDCLITLVYEAPIDEQWRAFGTALRQHLQLSVPEKVREIHVIGRSKGNKIVCGAEHVCECLTLQDGRSFRYLQTASGFSNPNPEVNRQALSWICDSIRSVQHDNQDLLELYCGNGNHTVAIAAYTRRLLAVEINKSLCQAANANLSLNGITNVTIVPCNSEHFASRILRNKKYIDKSNGTTYEFSTVLVDPPRCGLDDSTRSLVCGYENIVYISCNPVALHRDLLKICETHQINRMAIFDQFAYTPHIECGVFLSRK